jgi:hypothetical protein
MAKTINSYVADQGEVEVTISAGNVTAIAAFTTAEAIVIDGAVRSFKRTNNPERTTSSMRVTGDTTPITSTNNTIPHETWELVLVDDYHLGLAGEWGTDDLSAVEIFLELFKARQAPGAFKCTPAGGGSANIETTLADPSVLSVSEPEINADSTEPATVTVMLSASSSSKAAHG